MLRCLHEVLLHAECDDAVFYAEAACVAANLVNNSVEELDSVHLRRESRAKARPTAGQQAHLIEREAVPARVGMAATHIYRRLTMDGSLPSFEDRIAYIRSTHELEDQIVELAGHLNAGELSIPRSPRRVRSSQGLELSRHAGLRALAQLEVRHRPGCGAREGAHCARAREAAAGLGCDGARRDQLLEGARDHARGDA